MEELLRKDYCVYFHINPFTGEKFYVGKGTRQRPYSKHSRSKKWNEYVSEIGNLFDVEIYKQGLTDVEACKLETKILQNKDYSLINKSNNSVHKTGLLSICDSFVYDTTSPTFLRWKTPKQGSNKKPGDIAGSITNYVIVSHNGLQVKAHRLIWVMHNRMEIPPGLVINHIDCNPLNNAIENLECVTIGQNNQRASTTLNLRLRKDNSSGVNGLHRAVDGEDIRYSAHCKLNGIAISRSFSVNKYGESLAKEMAIYWRETVSSNIRDNVDNLTKDFDEKYGSIVNRDFPEGVMYTVDGKYPFSIAYITINRKTRRRKFSINKYGYDEAFRLACEWRKQAELQQTT